MGEQLPLFEGAVDLRRRNTALLSVGSVVAPHRQANAKAGESTYFKFFMIHMKVPIEMMFPVYIYRSTFWFITICLQITLPQCRDFK